MGGISDECVVDSPVLGLVWQLRRLPAPEPHPVRYNPRPPGVIRDGSASDAVLKYLRECGGFKTEAQLIWVTKRSHSAVSWALIYLIRQGLVEARPDAVRSSRYKKYRAVRIDL